MSFLPFPKLHMTSGAGENHTVRANVAKTSLADLAVIFYYPPVVLISALSPVLFLFRLLHLLFLPYLSVLMTP
jgi:hypothetical protein